MKKFILIICSVSFFLSGCFITNIFRKKEKYGCPVTERNAGAERILSGEKFKKSKYKGRKSLPE